jgi:endo-1,4-beta-mannosidase
MWQQFNSTEVDHDFAVLASVGFNAVRIFAVWDDFEPSLGSYNSTSFDNLEETLQLAKNHQLKVDMSVFVGWMSGMLCHPVILE